MDSAWKTRVLILGGGFAGLTVAMELEKTLGRDPSAEITLRFGLGLCYEFASAAT